MAPSQKKLRGDLVQCTVYLPEALHRALKIAAAKNGTTISQLVADALSTNRFIDHQPRSEDDDE